MGTIKEFSDEFDAIKYSFQIERKNRSLVLYDDYNTLLKNLLNKMKNIKESIKLQHRVKAYICALTIEKNMYIEEGTKKKMRGGNPITDWDHLFSLMNDDEENIKELKRTLDKDNINSSNKKGDTPLMMIMYSHMEDRDNINLMITWMIKDLGANINAANHEGHSPIHLALRFNIDCVPILLKLGADVEQSFVFVSDDGSSMMISPLQMLLLDFADNNATRERIKMLIDYGADVSKISAMKLDKKMELKNWAIDYAHRLNKAKKANSSAIAFLGLNNRSPFLQFLLWSENRYSQHC